MDIRSAPNYDKRQALLLLQQALDAVERVKDLRVEGVEMTAADRSIRDEMPEPVQVEVTGIRIMSRDGQFEVMLNVWNLTGDLLTPQVMCTMYDEDGDPTTSRTTLPLDRWDGDVTSFAGNLNDATKFTVRVKIDGDRWYSAVPMISLDEQMGQLLEMQQSPK